MKFKIIIASLFSIALISCATAQHSDAAINSAAMIQPNMTIDQVESILGKPVRIDAVLKKGSENLSALCAVHQAKTPSGGNGDGFVFVLYTTKGGIDGVGDERVLHAVPSSTNKCIQARS